MGALGGARGTQTDTRSTFVPLNAMCDVTQILSEIESGDPTAAPKLLLLVENSLRQPAAARLANKASSNGAMR